jgi:hypothetical protein
MEDEPVRDRLQLQNLHNNLSARL